MAAKRSNRSRERARRNESRWRWWLTPVVVLALALAAALIWANPRAPRPTELDAVSLELPAVSPPSAPLSELLTKQQSLYARLPAVLESAAKALEKGLWPPQPREALEALAKVEPPLDKTVLPALLAAGCFPVEKPDDTVSYLSLLRAVRALVVRAVSHVQLGEVQRGAGELLALHDRLYELEQRCAPTVVAAVVLGVCQGAVQRGWGFVLSHPTTGAALQAEIWRRMLALERRPSPFPNAFRWEAKWRRALIAAGFGGAARAKDEPMVWPYYDERDTRELGDLIGRRQVWLAEQPAGSPAWGQRFPEDEYLERLASAPRFLSLVRYNATGKLLMGIAIPPMRKFGLRWHRARCMVSAQRARWAQDLRERGRAVSEEAVRQAPRDPFTGRAFSPPPPAGLFVCVPPANRATGAREAPESGLSVQALPAAPSTTPPEPATPSP